MKKRLIHETRLKNHITGEETIVESSSLRGNDESFIMGRNTGGFDWINDLTALEIKLLFTLCSWKHIKDNSVDFGKGRISQFAEKYSCTVRSVSNNLRSLRKKGLIKQYNYDLYLVSPVTFYTGKCSRWKDYISEYNLAYDMKYDSGDGEMKDFFD